MSSGYDLRYSIIKEASSMLYEKWRMDCDANFRSYDAVRERWQSKGSNDEDFPRMVVPEAPSSEQILQIATELYEFVKKKD